MGISRYTAMVIQGNGDDIKCQAGGPDEDDKWAGYIYYYKDGEIHSLLLSTTPAYKSKKEAVEAMEEVVREIRKLEL